MFKVWETESMVLLNKIKCTITISTAIIAYFPLTFVFYHQSYANTYNFSVDYNISYTIAEDGTTTVDYNTKLTNLTSTNYAEKYNLVTGHKDIFDVKSYTPSGNDLPTTFTVAKNSPDGLASITTNLVNPVYGQGNSNNWIIEYKTKEVAQHIGHLWDIIIPGISKMGLINNLKINVTVPKDFGPLNYSSIANTQVTSTDSSYITQFNQDQIGAEGILVTFGQYQNYNFSYSYNLNNSSYTDSANYTITVPSNLNSQTIYFSKIVPQPSSVKQDTDGNYIISFSLSPRENKVASIQGIATVTADPNILSTPKSTVKNLSPNLLSIYTSPQKYWEVGNFKILDLAQKLTLDQTGIEAKEKSIYDYVVKTLHYDISQISIPNRNRFGALKTLSNTTKVICQEYVDLFVALSRASGVPSRMIAGYAQQSVASQIIPSDVLHAWAQYYDPAYGWVNVDPTWESTSGGLNYFGNVGSSHFALAVYGVSSENPPLVLSFTSAKKADQPLVINYTSNNVTPNDSFSIVNENQNSSTSGFKGTTQIGIKNTGNTVLFLQSANTTSTMNLILDSAFFNSTQPILPTLSSTITIPYTTKDFFYSGTKQYQLNVTAKSSSNTIHNSDQLSIIFSPLLLLQYLPWIVTLLIFMLSLGLVNGVIRIHKVIAKK